MGGFFCYLQLTSPRRAAFSQAATRAPQITSLSTTWSATARAWRQRPLVAKACTVAPKLAMSGEGPEWSLGFWGFWGFYDGERHIYLGKL